MLTIHFVSLAKSFKENVMHLHIFQLLFDLPKVKVLLIFIHRLATRRATRKLSLRCVAALTPSTQDMEKLLDMPTHLRVTRPMIHKVRAPMKTVEKKQFSF